MTMAVQKNYIDKLKYPYSDCNVDLRSDKFESRFSLKLKRNNQTYKQEFCFEVGESFFLKSVSLKLILR